ncbi:uncharacterized protein [Periplaneta americana]|uniref:uncharacterized protein n=1 Tax=Periplaneta americana TaxID=6978 RepID=UPI0037E807ED
MKIAFALMFLMAVAMWSVSTAEDPEEPQCDHIGYSPFSLREEICGSDGQTYSNEKHLQFENCLYRREIKKVKNGWCKEEDEKRAEAERKKLHDEYIKKLTEAEKKG